MTDNDDDKTMIGTNDSTTSAKRNCSEFMVINTGTNIHSSVRIGFDKTHLSTKDGTISTAINKAAGGQGRLGVDIVTNGINMNVVGFTRGVFARFSKKTVDRTGWMVR